MPLVSPPAVVEAAFVGPVSLLTQRCEFWESDLSRQWIPPVPIIYTEGEYRSTDKQDTGLENRIVDGTVTVDYSRDERRALDLTLDNTDNALKHDPDGGFWYDKIIKVYSGTRYYDAASSTPKVRKLWETQIGEFMIDRIDTDDFPYKMKVTGRDYTKKCASSFAVPTTFTKNSFVTTVIRSIAANAGVTKFLLPSSTELTTRTNTDFFFERGSSRWDAMKQIANAYGQNIFFDAQGYLNMTPFQDPLEAPNIYTFMTGPLFGNLIKYSKSTNDTRLFNHIIVTGETTDSTVAPVFAEAKNTEITSPSRIARIGDRVLPVTSALVTTVPQAQAMANNLLKVNALEEFEVSFEAIKLPWLEVGNIVTLRDPRASDTDPNRFLLSSLSLGLGLSPMSGVAKRVTKVGDTFGV